jgi:hypothetical protein
VPSLSVFDAARLFDSKKRSGYDAQIHTGQIVVG